jgi:ABC-type glutathione transport system ATPase component
MVCAMRWTRDWPGRVEAVDMDPAAPLLELQGLEVSFQTDGRTLNAVEGLDLRLERGEVLGLVGESGSGKSVSVMALMGLLDTNGRMTARRLRLDGKDLLTMESAAWASSSRIRRRAWTRATPWATS